MRDAETEKERELVLDCQSQKPWFMFRVYLQDVFKPRIRIKLDIFKKKFWCVRILVLSYTNVSDQVNKQTNK